MTERRTHITGFTLKVLAIVGMTANHASHVFGTIMPWQATLVLYSFGGVTFPIMAFLLVEGYLHTSSVRRYAIRLGVFALISQVPFTLCFGWGELPVPTLNVLFTLLLSLGLLWMFDNVQSRGLFFLAFIAVVALSCLCDWALIGPTIVFLFYALRNRGVAGILLTMLLPYAYTILPNIIELPNLLQLGISSAQNAAMQGIAGQLSIITVAGIPIHIHSQLFVAIAELGYALVGYTISTVFMCRYNGKRGRPMKWFFYAYYPAHLLVLWAIFTLFFA